MLVAHEVQKKPSNWEELTSLSHPYIKRWIVSYQKDGLATLKSIQLKSIYLLFFVMPLKSKTPCNIGEQQMCKK